MTFSSRFQESQGSSRTRASWSSAGTRTAFVVTFSYVDVMAGIPIHDDQGTYDRPHYLTMKFDPAKMQKLPIVIGEKKNCSAGLGSSAMRETSA
ncbi:MAG: hypothetical protein JO137_08870 [Hyphomicrobiales bacterium]|nr:hypothetical protein [Hyphomicrobiales bacterium]MBV9431921.1 hypothetical protein [Hyphomicrobiales bacterium]